VYLVAASFAAMLALIPYLTIWGPGDVGGLQASFDGGAMRVNAVESDSQLAHAGLAAGDRVVAIDGWPLRNTCDWEIVQANQDTVRPQRWEILRGAERVDLQIPPERATLENRLVAHGYLGYIVTAAGCFILALLIAFQRASDPVAIMCAWFIMTASVAFGLPSNWALVWRQLPFVVQLLLWIPAVSRFVIDGIFLSLFVMFPRRLFHSRWLWAALWIPVLATLPWRISGFNSMIHPMANSAAVPAWLNQAIFLRTMAYLTTAIAILVFSYRRLASPNERRRVRVLVTGTAVAFAGAIFLVWYFNFVGKGLAVANAWLEQIGFILLLACPLAFYYAIIRHRAFDIQVIIRQGLQYALARGAVLGVVPVLAAMLVVDLAFNSQQPLIEILRERGWIHVGLSGLALLSYSKRKQWLDALDRRFFRERYDAQRLLRDTVKEIREAKKSLEQVAARVVGRIEAALHSEFVALVLRRPGDPEYRSVACAPSGFTVPTILAESKLVALVRVLGKPFEVLADSAWLERQLPSSEIQFARQARIDLLVPIDVSPGRQEALLVLGIKRSEEPYTRDDQELLDAIASSLALLLEPPVPVAAGQTAMFGECPDCGMCYETSSGTCAGEGASLVSIRLPRTLTGRYRLERRRGRGGMGTVYEATDIALERHVAVKVIREDFVNSADAAQRFRRESRAAAGFSHPNVVTVHDYGVDGARAFLVMELLNGENLRDEITRLKRLSQNRTLEIFRGVCAAMEAAHQRQLIHRDLKPENIFLARTESKGEIVKVLDFGIAKFIVTRGEDAPTRLTADTGSGILVGTPAYMSPEQLLGENPTLFSDLWALGVVAYECLTGAGPFTSTPTRDWRSNILSGNFTPVREHLADAPSTWQAFFQECFAVDSMKRPVSVTDFLRKLEGASLSGA
jgi:serine/threonine-protein kinase